MINKHINLANILSFSRIIFGIIFFILFLYTKINNISISSLLIIDTISLIIFIIAIITDGLDGYFARKKDKVTDFGKHFDPLSDSIFFIIVFLTFLILGLLKWYFFVLIFLREAFMHILLRPYLKSKGKSLPANIYGKIKTILQATFSIIILSFMIFQNILGLFMLDNKILSMVNYIIYILAFIFFAIITFISITSLLIYIIQSRSDIKS